MLPNCRLMYVSDLSMFRVSDDKAWCSVGYGFKCIFNLRHFQFIVGLLICNPIISEGVAACRIFLFGDTAIIILENVYMYNIYVYA